MEQGGRFAVRQLLPVAQLDDLPVGAGQFGDHSAEQDVKLFALGDGFGARGWIFENLHKLGDGNPGCPGVPAPGAFGAVGDDGAYPSTGWRAAAVGVDALQNLDPTGLQDISRLVVPACDAPGERQKAAGAARRPFFPVNVIQKRAGLGSALKARGRKLCGLRGALAGGRSRLAGHLAFAANPGRTKPAPAKT